MQMDVCQHHTCKHHCYLRFITMITIIIKKKIKKNFKAFTNVTSDALASNGFVSMLSNLFLCLDNDGMLKFNSNATTNV